MGAAFRTIDRRPTATNGELSSELSDGTAGLLSAVDAGLDTWSTAGWIAGRLMSLFRDADEVDVRLGRPQAGRTEWGIRLTRDGGRTVLAEPAEAEAVPADCLLRVREGEGPVEQLLEGAVRDGEVVEAVIAVRCVRPAGTFTGYELDLLAELCRELGPVLRMARLRDALGFKVDPADPLLRAAGSWSRRLPLLDNVKFLVEQRGGDGTAVDFYDAFWLAPYRLAIALGTALGEPSRAALVAAWARARIRVASLGATSARPDRVLATVRADLASSGLGDARIDGLVLAVDLRTREAAYCSTGSESLMVWRRSVTGLQRIRLGLTERKDEDFSTSMATSRMKLAPGDSVVLASGGVVEAHDALARPFGLARLEKSLAGGANQRLSEMISRAMTDLRAYGRGGKSTRDVTVLGVVLSAAAPMTTLNVPPARSSSSERLISEREAISFLGEGASRPGS